MKSTVSKKTLFYVAACKVPKLNDESVVLSPLSVAWNSILLGHHAVLAAFPVSMVSLVLLILSIEHNRVTLAGLIFKKKKGEIKKALYVVLVLL